jgi:hypothetical protein
MARSKQKTSDPGTLERPTPRRKPGDPSAAGQAGDLQGLPGTAEADSQSVRELVEDGQAYEAAVVSGVENAPPADEAEVETTEVPEDDVPPEYTDKDPDEPKD